MPVFTVDLEKVRRRADFFLEEATSMCRQPHFEEFGFDLSEENALFLAEAYFLVNYAYKARRQLEGHRTVPAKIAAITSAVVATLNPLRPSVPPEAANNVTIYANPLFALRLGCNIIGHPFHKRPWSQKMWFCDSLREETLTSLGPYLDRVGAGVHEVGSSVDIDLSLPELRRLEGRFNFYTVLGEMPVYRNPG